MCDGEVIRRGVRRVCIGLGERSVRIADDLIVAVILHHDDEHMVQMRNALGDLTLLSECRSCQCCSQ